MNHWNQMVQYVLVEACRRGFHAVEDPDVKAALQKAIELAEMHEASRQHVLIKAILSVFPNVSQESRDEHKQGLARPVQDFFDELLMPADAIDPSAEIQFPPVDEEKLAKSIAQEKAGIRGKPAKEVFDTAKLLQSFRDMASDFEKRIAAIEAKLEEIEERLRRLENKT